MPFANFAGGQIYNVSSFDSKLPLVNRLSFKVGGFLAVYITSLAFVILGIGYILVIPESVVKRTGAEEGDESKEDEKKRKVNPFVRLWRFLFRQAWSSHLQIVTYLDLHIGMWEQMQKKYPQVAKRQCCLFASLVACMPRYIFHPNPSKVKGGVWGHWLQKLWYLWILF